MKIFKADGTQEDFKPKKLISSLKMAGAGQHEINTIVQKIESSLVEGATTSEIYRKAFELLRSSKDPIAARYSLRRAVIGLGPTGFPFEDFLGRLFEAEGYRTKRRLTLRGKCATHEIDLAAYSNEHTFIAEAKFHARPGIKTDLQVAMYSYARYLDLVDKKVCMGDQCGIVTLLLATNTKFTSAAVKYAACTGIKLLSWDYPRGDSLHDKISRSRAYPITVLTTISNSQKQILLQNGVILCSDILKRPNILNNLNLGGKKTDSLLHEISLLCGVQ